MHLDRRRVTRLLAWAPLAACAIYLAVLGAFFKRLVVAWNLSSDANAPMVITDRLKSGLVHGGPTFAAQPIYIVIDTVIRGLPAHRMLWQVLPTALAIATAALIGWSVAQVATPWAGALAGILSIALTPTVLATAMVQAVHGMTYFSAALLAAFLVHTLRTTTVSWRLIVGAVVVAIVVGVGIASDVFLLFTGAIPLGVATVVVLYLAARRRDKIRSAILVASVALGTGLTTLAARVAFRSAGLLTPAPPGPGGLADLAEMRGHIHLLGRGFIALTGGVVPPDRQTRVLELAMLARAALAMAALVFIGTVLFRQLRANFSPEPPSLARTAAIVFWSSSAVVVAAAFVISRVASDIGSARYLIPCYFAVGALASIGVDRTLRRRTIAALAVTVATVVAAAEIFLVAYGGFELEPARQQLPDLITVLQTHHLSRGYANYWDSNVISWKTHGRIEVLPVFEGCRTGDKAILCPYYWEVSRNAYLPVAGPSFVVVGLNSPGQQPSERIFGSPTSVLHVDGLRIYVFKYDVASRFAARPLPSSSTG